MYETRWPNRPVFARAHLVQDTDGAWRKSGACTARRGWEQVEDRQANESAERAALATAAAAALVLEAGQPRVSLCAWALTLNSARESGRGYCCDSLAPWLSDFAS